MRGFHFYLRGAASSQVSDGSSKGAQQSCQSLRLPSPNLLFIFISHFYFLFHTDRMFSKKNIVVAATSSLLVLSLISQVSGERKVSTHSGMFDCRPSFLTIPALIYSIDVAVVVVHQVMPKHTKDQHITSPLPYKLFTRSATYTSTPQMRTNGGNNKEEKLKLPRNFSWLTFQGVSYLTRSLNQHLPTYCGSCWAHAAVSVLADRIKIQRMLASSSALSSLSSSRVDSDSTYGTSTSDYGSDGLGYSFPDVYLSIQFILNCGGEVAGSCKGGKYHGVESIS